MKLIPNDMLGMYDKFYSRCIPVTESGCWIWESTSQKYGYGQIVFRGTVYMAHRVSYFLSNPGFDQKMIIMHKCDNRICVNPSHLLAGTPAQNSKDMVNKNRQNKGIGICTAKLTPETVLAIYNAKGSYREIGEQYGVDNTNVSLIKNGKIWKSITGGVKNVNTEWETGFMKTGTCRHCGKVCGLGELKRLHNDNCLAVIAASEEE